MSGSSVPELLGFVPVPFDREKRYSAVSYQVLYMLTEDEARDLLDSHTTHPQIDLTMSNRYVSDPTYRKRVNDARQDITGTEASEDVKRVMERMNSRGEVA